MFIYLIFTPKKDFFFFLISFNFALRIGIFVILEFSFIHVYVYVACRIVILIAAFAYQFKLSSSSIQILHILNCCVLWQSILLEAFGFLNESRHFKWKLMKLHDLSEWRISEESLCAFYDFLNYWMESLTHSFSFNVREFQNKWTKKNKKKNKYDGKN